jgi:hypothetical protein
MGEMMKKVFVPREKIPCAGVVIIGPDDGRQVWFPPEDLCDLAYQPGRNSHIRIDKEKDISRCLSRSSIPRLGGTSRNRLADYPDAQFLSLPPGIALITVSYDNDFSRSR